MCLEGYLGKLEAVLLFFYLARMGYSIVRNSFRGIRSASHLYLEWEMMQNAKNIIEGFMFDEVGIKFFPI